MSNWELYFDIDEGDLRISNGQYEIARGANVVAQQLDITLNMQLTTWYLQQSLGVPWDKVDIVIDEITYELGILGSNFDATTINAILIKVINDVPGVIKINKLTITQAGGGVLNISGSVTVETGAVNAIGLNNTAVLHSENNTNSLNFSITK